MSGKPALKLRFAKEQEHKRCDHIYLLIPTFNTKPEELPRTRKGPTRYKHAQMSTFFPFVSLPYSSEQSSQQLRRSNSDYFVFTDTDQLQETQRRLQISTEDDIRQISIEEAVNLIERKAGCSGVNPCAKKTGPLGEIQFRNLFFLQQKKGKLYFGHHGLHSVCRYVTEKRRFPFVFQYLCNTALLLAS